MTQVYGTPEQPTEGVQSQDAVDRAEAAPTDQQGQTAPDSATPTTGGPTPAEPDDEADGDAGQQAG